MSVPSATRRGIHPAVLPAIAGLVLVLGVVVVASRAVQRSGAAFTDQATGSIGIQSGRVDVTPDTPASLSFSGLIGPGASASQTITITNASTVTNPAACVVLDVLPVRVTSPNAFSEALGSVISVTVERKAGTAASAAAWTTVTSGNLTALAPASVAAFGAGLEAATTNDATNQNGAPMDNGEAVTYRLTFSMSAAVGNTVSYGGSPVTITNAYADAEFRFVAENVTAGTCAGAVSA